MPPLPAFLVDADADPPPRAGIPPDAVAHSRVLVLGDDADDVAHLERLLTSAGYTSVRGVTGPDAAPACLVDDPPDLVLLDLKVSRADGLEALSLLARHVAGPASLPVLVLSPDASVTVRRQVLTAGARDVVGKPFDPLEVLLRVGNLLQMRHQHRRMHERNLVLEQGDRRRTAELMELAADLAQETRTPLYSIRGLVEVLLDFEGTLPTGLRRDLELIDGVAQDALTVVDRQIADARSAAQRGRPQP